MKPALQTTPLLVAVIMLLQVVVVSGQDNPVTPDDHPCPGNCTCTAYTHAVNCIAPIQGPLPRRTADLTITRVGDFVTINETLLAELTQLSTLAVISCPLRSIVENAFARNGQLRNLTLRDNQLTKESLSAISHLPSLEVLDLSQNRQIGDFLSQSPFGTLTRLRELRLNDCNITWINATIFNELTHLQTLSLESNHLSHLPDRIFDRNAANITHIYLNDNDFANLNGEEVFGRFRLQVGKKFTITLQSNPWNCTCELYNGLISVWLEIIDRSSLIVWPSCRNPARLAGSQNNWNTLQESDFCPVTLAWWQRSDIRLYLIAGGAAAFTILMICVTFCICTCFGSDERRRKKRKPPPPPKRKVSMKKRHQRRR